MYPQKRQMKPDTFMAIMHAIATAAIVHGVEIVKAVLWFLKIGGNVNIHYLLAGR